MADKSWTKIEKEFLFPYNPQQHFANHWIKSRLTLPHKIFTSKLALLFPYNPQQHFANHWIKSRLTLPHKIFTSKLAFDCQIKISVLNIGCILFLLLPAQRVNSLCFTWFISILSACIKRFIFHSNHFKFLNNECC